MRFFSRLWQRVFLLSLIMILISGAMCFSLVHENLINKAASLTTSFTLEIRDALADKNPDQADNFLRTFNQRDARFWVEDSRGILLAGERAHGRTGKDWGDYLLRLRHSGEVVLWQTNIENPLFLGITPCTLKGREGVLYATYMSFPIPPLETWISPSIVSIMLFTGFLAFWISRIVGRPLRRLQKEVSEISGTLQLRDVTVVGSGEVAEVGKAINRLVHELRRHIAGMNQLVLNISHELRSPLARMTLSAEMIGQGLELLKKQEEKPEQATVIARAHNNYNAMLQELEYVDSLIGETLLSSRLDMKDTEDLREDVDFSALAQNTFERYEAVFRQADVRFMHSVAKDIVVRGDATLLIQVLSNLLDNAAKYASDPEPRVRLSLFREEGKAVLCVENSHNPLPEEALGHIFDAYYRYDQQVGTGVGLGLAIVQKIAELHRGTITASNGGLGITFRLTLPLRGL